MKRIDLTPKGKERLEKRHKACSNGKERDRIKAILLYSEGWTVAMISQALRIHETTVNRHLNDYGFGKLKPENGGSESSLTEEQTVKLIAHLEEKTYHHVHEIIEYVSQEYDVMYSVPGMNKWLHRHGFSYKNPKGHPRQATKLSYGWIRTGQTKKINTTASRTRVNLVGAIELENLNNIQICEYAVINAESIVDFLSQIRQKHLSANKIHLILDKAGYHRAKEVKKAAKKLGIKLHYLPPYSPNLNPIERLWKVMNEHARNNRFFKSSKDFRSSLCNFFRYTLPEISGSLTSRINDNFQIL